MNLTTLVPLIVIVLLVERALHARAPWPWIFWVLLGLVALLELMATARRVVDLVRLLRTRPPQQ